MSGDQPPAVGRKDLNLVEPTVIRRKRRIKR